MSKIPKKKTRLQILKEWVLLTQIKNLDEKCQTGVSGWKPVNSQKRLGTPLPKNRQARFPLSEYIFQGTIRKEIARSMWFYNAH